MKMGKPVRVRVVASTLFRDVLAHRLADTPGLRASGGLLDRYIGDGLKAVFRVSGSTAEALAAAVRGALSVRDAARAIAQGEDGEKRLAVWVGMHSGEAVVGLVESASQVNYTAHGITAAISQRLQRAAEEGEVLISDAVWIFVQNQFGCGSPRYTSLRHVEGQVLAYPVLAELA